MTLTKLRCPECAAEITIGENAYLKLEQPRDTEPVGVHRFLAVLKDDPIVCPGCSVTMKIVRECPACKGYASLSVEIGRHSASVGCPECDRGEILEEQSCSEEQAKS